MAWQPVNEERRSSFGIGGAALTLFLGLSAFTAGVFSDARWGEVVSIVGLVCVGLGAAWSIRAVAELLKALRPLRAIDSALRAYQDGERRPDALRIDTRWGELADSWSDILSQHPDPAETAAQAALDSITSSGSEGDLAIVFQALHLGVVILDGHGHILRINGAGRILLSAGINEEDVVGAPVHDHLGDGELGDIVRCIIEGTIRQGVGRLTHGEGSGRTVIQIRARRLRDEGQTAAIILSCEDITQRELKDESHSHSLSHATHELRTPLTNIRLYAEEAVESDAGDVETRARALDVILTETRRLERTVTDMLSASEIEAGTLSVALGPMRLENLFGELESDFRAMAQAKDLALSFELPPKYPVARADREKLTLAVHNLVGNAIKYTPEGGRVDVIVDADDSVLVVTVKDTGIGIDERERERIFDRFYRAGDDRVKAITGTGLGLCLAREIARLHGGDITIESELDKGSEFTLTIPVAERRRAAA